MSTVRLSLRETAQKYNYRVTGGARGIKHIPRRKPHKRHQAPLPEQGAATLKALQERRLFSRSRLVNSSSWAGVNVAVSF